MEPFETSTSLGSHLAWLPGRALEALKTWALGWPGWWRALTTVQKLFPILFVGVYWTSLWMLRGFRADHLSVGFIILILSYGGKSARIGLNFLWPLLLTGIVYDSQRFYSDYIRGPIHVNEPYLFDQRFFGISTLQGVLTPNEWWQLHTYPILDLVTGFFCLHCDFCFDSRILSVLG
jgi:hypothetical protein